ncbi:ornithine cyclodeaminase [Amylibacter kogurei]|uniref:Ornithine cyclodeaminase n=1 Tax=Paramylibacter kogurei TaxID=1889778 RepID=A0A2G5KAV3_9RHOB|nr:ornithine cyclodeaminase [Amylibacter kogurei]PIB26657.1 ornithine cyclodeaminase [Amylibacter kogurei]
MTHIPLISFDEMDKHLSWKAMAEAIRAGHDLPKAQLQDVFIRRDSDTLLNRSAWVDGLGVAVKAATVFPKSDPSVDGGMLVFDDDSGALQAVVDFKLVTKWKTVADSMLGASLLARPKSKRLLVVGAGTVAENLISAYQSFFDLDHISVWSRTEKSAQKLAAKTNTTPITDLESAAIDADIISCATMATEPVVSGDWLQAGQHIDLIGAYRGDMREVDDAALTRARIFVDSRDTTIDHIGELKIPISQGVITANDIIADYYDIPMGKFARNSDDEITLFKNGGGAHMDLMIAKAIIALWQNINAAGQIHQE